MHHGYRRWFSRWWNFWWGWWTISMWICGPRHFIFKDRKCVPRNYNFVEKWSTATYNYRNSSCIIETIPSKFHLLGVFFLWMMIYMWILKICKCCNVLFTYQKKWQVIFYPKVLFWKGAWLRIIRLMGTLPWILMFIQLRGMKYIKKQCKRNCAIFVVQQKLSIDQQLHKFLFLTSSQLEWIDLLSILSTCGIYKHLDPLSFKIFILQWSMKVLILYHLNLLICQLLWFTYPSLWFEPLILLFFMIWWTPHVVIWSFCFVNSHVIIYKTP